MKRFLLIMQLAVTMFLLVAAEQAIGSDRSPNIVLIMADDVSWECFGCYGAEDYKTPLIDKLAAEGMRFEHCYSTPICTPSRVKIMTGKYGFRNYTHFGYLHPDERTFGHLLQQAGYKTAVAGKWQLNGLYNNLPGHGDSTRPQKTGFDESLLWQVTKTKGQGGERFWNPAIEHNGQFLSKQDNLGKYGPDLFTDFVCDFISRNQEQPFFVYYPMVLVHDPFVPTPDSVGEQTIRDSLNREPKAYAEKKENFVAMVAYMDKLVGRITQHIDELGLAEDTILLFTADNGTNTKLRSQWNGREIRGGKAGMKDNGTHVPLVVRWKGHGQAGSVLPDLVDFTDFYATFAEAAGVELTAADPVDGRSFFPQLNGLTGNPRDWVLCHYQCYWNKQPGQYARNATYKLYRDGRFFDISTDLDEATDLGGSLSGDALSIQRELKHLLDRCPPVPPGALGKDASDRPLHPDVPNLFQESNP